MAYGCIACGAFQQGQATGKGAAHNHAFKPSVLITQSNLKVQHVFTVALKAEMPRLNNPGMYGANGNFVDFFAFNPVEGIGLGSLARRCGKRAAFGLRSGIGFGGVRDAAHRLEPGMSLGPYAPLFKYLAFKQMRLRRSGRHGSI